MDEKTISFKRRSSDTSVVDYAVELFRTRAAADISIICDSMHFRCHKVLLGLHFPVVAEVLRLEPDIDALLAPQLNSKQIDRLLMFMYLGNIIEQDEDDLHQLQNLLSSWGNKNKVTITRCPSDMQLPSTNLQEVCSTAPKGVTSSSPKEVSSPSSKGVSSDSFKEVSSVSSKGVSSVASKRVISSDGMSSDRRQGRLRLRNMNLLKTKNGDDCQEPSLEPGPRVPCDLKPEVPFETEPEVPLEPEPNGVPSESLAKCPICREPCTAEDRVVHSQVHSPTSMFECFLCLQPFTDMVQLMVHRDIHPDRLHCCTDCQETFPNLHQLHLHHQHHQHLQHQSHQLHSDDDQDTKSEDLKSEIPDAANPLESVPPEEDILPPEMDFKSENEICDVCFLSLSNQQNHFSLHRSGCSFECMFCLQGFNAFEEMRNHIEDHNNRYECRSCKLVFKDFYSMEDHSRSCGNSSIPSGDHSRSCEDRSQPLGDHLRSSGDPSISSFSLLTDSKPDIQRRPEADISLISPSSSRERGRDGERINDAREMDGKPLVEPREGDGRSICCKDIEAEVKIAYLSCPKAKLRYECPLCKQSLGPNKTCYSTHLQLHSSSSAKACRLCYQEFSSSEEMNLHLSQHSDKRFLCPCCSFSSLEHSQLLLHFDTEQHPPRGSFNSLLIPPVEIENKSYGQESLCESSPNIECRICYEELDNLELFYSHVRIHSGKEELECKYCFQGYSSLNLLLLHLDEEHGAEAQQKYSCPYCEFASRNKNLLIKHCRSSEHISGVELNLAPFRKLSKPSLPGDLAVSKGKELKMCPVCQFGVEGDRALKSHQKLHVTGFAFECMFCLMGFMEESRLQKHRNIHNNNWECLTCSDEFDSYTRFVKHLEDSGHNERYSQSINRYDLVSKTREIVNLSQVSVNTLVNPQEKHSRVNIKRVKVNVSKLPGCGVCDRCRKVPCQLCLSCQRGRTCRFKKCHMFANLDEQDRGNAGANSTVHVAPTVPKPSPDFCHVCHLNIPPVIQNLHRDIHCAAFGVEKLENIDAKQCMYCLKIMFNKPNFRKHLETQHLFSRREFYCQRCSLETSSLVQFINHLHMQNHFPNKMGRKKAAKGQQKKSKTNLATSRSRSSSRNRSLTNTTRRRSSRGNRRKDVEEEVSGGEESGQDEDEVGERGEGQLYTCNQCNLSFSSLAACSTHLSNHKNQRQSEDSRKKSPAPCLRRRLPRRSSQPSSPAFTPSSCNTNNKAVKRTEFTYSCSRCSYSTQVKSNLFIARPQDIPVLKDNPVTKERRVSEDIPVSGDLKGSRENQVLNTGQSVHSCLEGLLNPLVMCTRCEVLLANEAQLSEHITEHHASSTRKLFEFELRDPCGYCKPCTNLESVQSEEPCILFPIHMMGFKFRQEPASDQSCLICQEVLKGGQLVEHLQLHSGIHPAACKHCFKEFTTSKLLRAHSPGCRFRKSSKYKCMLCSTVESSQIDVLHHYHSQHSSRLNVTLRPLVDALFTRREKQEESSSQEEEISCDEKSSSLQKPVFTPFIQSDDLKKSDLQKILEFISQNSKDVLGVSMDLIQAYFNSGLESSWFKYSLQANLKDYVKNGYLNVKNIGEEEVYTITRAGKEKQRLEDKERCKRKGTSNNSRRRSKRLKDESSPKLVSQIEPASAQDVVKIVEEETLPCIADFDNSDSEPDIEEWKNNLDSFLNDDPYSPERKDVAASADQGSFKDALPRAESKLEDFSDFDVISADVELTDIEPTLNSNTPPLIPSTLTLLSEEPNLIHSIPSNSISLPINPVISTAKTDFAKYEEPSVNTVITQPQLRTLDCTSSSNQTTMCSSSTDSPEMTSTSNINITLDPSQTMKPLTKTYCMKDTDATSPSIIPSNPSTKPTHSSSELTASAREQKGTAQTVLSVDLPSCTKQNPVVQSKIPSSQLKNSTLSSMSSPSIATSTAISKTHGPTLHEPSTQQSLSTPQLCNSVINVSSAPKLTVPTSDSSSKVSVKNSSNVETGFNLIGSEEVPVPELKSNCQDVIGPDPHATEDKDVNSSNIDTSVVKALSIEHQTILKNKGLSLKKIVENKNIKLHKQESSEPEKRDKESILKIQGSEDSVSRASPILVNEKTKLKQNKVPIYRREPSFKPSKPADPIKPPSRPPSRATFHRPQSAPPPPVSSERKVCQRKKFGLVNTKFYGKHITTKNSLVESNDAYSTLDFSSADEGMETRPESEAKPDPNLTKVNTKSLGTGIKHVIVPGAVDIAHRKTHKEIVVAKVIPAKSCMKENLSGSAVSLDEYQIKGLKTIISKAKLPGEDLPLVTKQIRCNSKNQDNELDIPSSSQHSLTEEESVSNIVPNSIKPTSSDQGKENLESVPKQSKNVTSCNHVTEKVSFSSQNTSEHFSLDSQYGSTKVTETCLKGSGNPLLTSGHIPEKVLVTAQHLLDTAYIASQHVKEIPKPKRPYHATRRKRSQHLGMDNLKLIYTGTIVKPDNADKDDIDKTRQDRFKAHKYVDIAVKTCDKKAGLIIVNHGKEGHRAGVEAEKAAKYAEKGKNETENFIDDKNARIGNIENASEKAELKVEKITHEGNLSSNHLKPMKTSTSPSVPESIVSKGKTIEKASNEQTARLESQKEDSVDTVLEKDTTENSKELNFESKSDKTKTLKIITNGKEKDIDYEEMCINAVKQLAVSTGASVKDVHQLLTKSGIRLQKPIVSLCLSSAAVSGKLEQVEAGGSSYYKVGSDTGQPSVSLGESGSGAGRRNKSPRRSEPQTSASNSKLNPESRKSSSSFSSLLPAPQSDYSSIKETSLVKGNKLNVRTYEPITSPSDEETASNKKDEKKNDKVEIHKHDSISDDISSNDGRDSNDALDEEEEDPNVHAHLLKKAEKRNKKENQLEIKERAETKDTSEAFPTNPTCPVCFRFLLNGARMKKHIQENHPNFNVHEPIKVTGVKPRPSPGYPENGLISENPTQSSPSMCLSISPSGSTSSIESSQTGIKLRISFKSPSCERKMEVKEEKEKGDIEENYEDEENRRKKKEEIEEKRRKERKRKRPRDNIIGRVDMHNIKRMKITIGDELMGERRMVHHPAPQDIFTGPGVPISQQMEPLMGWITDIRHTRRIVEYTDICHSYAD